MNLLENKFGSFNTGRGYSEHGQIIEYAVLATEHDDLFDVDIHRVYMNDTTRGLEYVLSIVGNVNQESIMNSYDSGNNDHPTLKDTGMFMEIIEGEKK